MQVLIPVMLLEHSADYLGRRAMREARRKTMWPNEKEKLFSTVWPILKAAGDRKDSPEPAELPCLGPRSTDEGVRGACSGASSLTPLSDLPLTDQHGLRYAK